MAAEFLSATVLLFLIFDPFGNTPMVAAALRQVAPERRIRVILRECAIAYGVLVVFLLGGRQFLSLLQLSQTSLGIAGGVVLFLIALRMIFPPPEGGGVFGEPVSGEPFIVPLAVPAIAGPSAMAMVMLLVSRDPEHILVWLASLTLATAASAAVLLVGDRLVTRLGERLMTAIERLMGLILCALAVEMLLRGVETFVRELQSGSDRIGAVFSIISLAC